MTNILRQATCVVCAGMIMLALTALPARAIDINDLPGWVRDSIQPVQIDWSQVYPGLAPPPAWAQNPAVVQEVDPASATPQAAGIGTLSTVTPAGPSSALGVAHPTTAATGGLQTVSPSPLGSLQTASPASGQSGIGGLAPVHPSAAATAGLHEVNPTPAAMTGLQEAHPTSATAGLQPVSAGPIVADMSRLAPTDTQAQQLLLNWRTEAEYAGMVVTSAIRRDLVEQNIRPETMVGALQAIPLAHPMEETYLPVCEVLWGSLGEDVEACLQLPYAARIYMATYLAVQGRDEEFKALICSLENPSPMVLGSDLYHVACELLDHRECAYNLAIWAHKRGADLRGPADQAFVANAVMQSCRKLGDTDVTRRELIPWAEEALGRPGGESRWGYALQALMWAYAEVGDTEKAVDRGLYWLNFLKGKELGPRTFIENSEVTIARLAADIGRIDAAAVIYQQIVDSATPASAAREVAYAELAALAAKHPDTVAHPHGLVPRVRDISPQEITGSVPLGGRFTTDIIIRGNPALTVTGATSTVAGIIAANGPHTLERIVTSQVMRLEVGPEVAVGPQTGTLRFETNDPERPVLEVAFRIEVQPPISVRPPRLSFVATFAGSGSAVTILQSGMPFEVKQVVVDRPEAISVEVARQYDGSALLRARVQGAHARGRITGVVSVHTTLEAQPTIEIAYTITPPQAP